MKTDCREPVFARQVSDSETDCREPVFARLESDSEDRL